jgi:PmbA protein
VPGSAFSHPIDQLRKIAADVLDHARGLGATAAETEVSEGFGQNVTVRRGEVETIEYNRDKGVGVTVYVGQQRGHASTSDFSPQAVRDPVQAAFSIARFTAADDCAGLADPDLLAHDVPDLDLYHPDLPWSRRSSRRVPARRPWAGPAHHQLEGRRYPRSSALHLRQFLGFMVAIRVRHSLMCSVIAGEGDEMQRDDWYALARAAEDLEGVEDVGRRAGERCVRRLGARRLETMEVPVLFEAPVASGLLGHFVGAVSGGSLYRKASFLLDSLGQQIFAPQVQIRDIPDVKRGLASSPFDDEGVGTQRRDVVRNGVLQGYFLGSYSARKLGCAHSRQCRQQPQSHLDHFGRTFRRCCARWSAGFW